MARLFYHEPQFAILDECTSAVSVDVEGFIYSHCREVRCTMHTVTVAGQVTGIVFSSPERDHTLHCISQKVTMEAP